jgi:hypothetical protein
VAFSSSQKESDGTIKDTRDLSKSVPSDTAYALYQELITQMPIDKGMLYLNLSNWCAGEEVRTNQVEQLDEFYIALKNSSSDWEQTDLFKANKRFRDLTFNSYVSQAITVTMPCGYAFERNPAPGVKNFLGLLVRKTPSVPRTQQ